MAELFLASIALVLLTFANAEYDVQKMCQLIPRGTKLPSKETCQKYYICLDGDTAAEASCPGDDVFDKDVQGCVPVSESSCNYGLANPCYNKHEQFAYNTQGCNWYYYCRYGQVVGDGTCPMGQKFYAANSSCIYGSCDSNNQFAIEDMCEIMPEGVFFGDFDDCHNWHKCVNMNQESGVCPIGNDGVPRVFDVVSGYCKDNDGNMCQRTNNVVPSLASGPPQEACTSVDQIVGDTNVCSLYYTCEIASQKPTVTYKWVQKSCKTQYFDVISKTCSDTFAARPYPTCDRCELKDGYSRNYWINAIDSNCKQYFTCTNGQKVSTVKQCGPGLYFDESAQACYGIGGRIEVYQKYHGACQDYTCTDARVCSLASTEEESNSQPPANAAASEDKDKGDSKPDENAAGDGKPEKETTN